MHGHARKSTEIRASVPLGQAAQIAVNAVTEWRDELLNEVIFCCFSDKALAVYREIINATDCRDFPVKTRIKTLMLSILRSNELGLLKIIEKSQKILC